MGIFGFVDFLAGYLPRPREPRQALPKDPLVRLLDGWPVDVTSSHHRTVIWERDTLIMTFLTHDGKSLAYQGVSEEMVRSYWAATSKGGWFWDNIRVRGEGNSKRHRMGISYLGGGS